MKAPRLIAKREVARSPSGREMRDLSLRTLRRYSCALCGQRLDRIAKRGETACCRMRFGGYDVGCAWSEHFAGGEE